MDSQEKRRGTPGWRSIHAAKLEILGQYRTAKHLSQSHTVKTFHGNVAESSINDLTVEEQMKVLSLIRELKNK